MRMWRAGLVMVAAVALLGPVIPARAETVIEAWRSPGSEFNTVQSVSVNTAGRFMLGG